MNEWKELKIDNLPSDILTGDYEFQVWGRNSKGELPNAFYDYKNYNSIFNLLVSLKAYRYRYRYRKPEQPNYETLAECYINDDMGALGLNLPHDLLRDAVAEIQENCEREVKLAFIAGRESADIPPETIEEILED